MFFLLFYLALCSVPCVYLLKESGDEELCGLPGGFEPALSVQLSGTTGFHREVVTTVELGSETPGDVRALLLYTWPRGVYVDPYQLASMSDPDDWQMLFNTTIDLEEPAHRASACLTYVYPSRTGPSPGPLTVTIPIHGRYHEPSFGGKSFTAVHIEPPELLLWTKTCSSVRSLEPHSVLDAPCDASNTSICSWIKTRHTHKNPPPVRLNLPVGDGCSATLVCAGTLLLTVICCAALCHSILKHPVT